MSVTEKPRRAPLLANGLICFEGHVLRLVLSPGEVPKAPAEAHDWYAS